jgi:hypothetical protein
MSEEDEMNPVLCDDQLVQTLNDGPASEQEDAAILLWTRLSLELRVVESDKLIATAVHKAVVGENRVRSICLGILSSQALIANSQEKKRARIFRALASIRDQLKVMANDAEAVIRCLAIECLGQLMKHEDTDPESIVHGLRDRESQVRLVTCMELINWRQYWGACVQSLTEAASTYGDSERAEVAATLGEFGPEALGSLERMIQDRSASVRMRAAESLWRVSNDSRLVIKIAEELLDYDGETDRSLECRAEQVRAVELIGDIGNCSTEAIWKLRELCEDVDDRVRAAAKVALGRVNGLQAI